MDQINQHQRRPEATTQRLRDIYSNTAETGFTVNFFSLLAPSAQTAALACPFFTHYAPIQDLTDRGCEVKLLVRLCDATDPNALRRALADPSVTVRYFTSRLFHAKFYIIDDVALVGSANLTHAGLHKNREVSVTLHRGRDEAFDALPGLFDDLFNQADQLDPAVITAFEEALRKHGDKSHADEDFEAGLTDLIPAADPTSIVTGSGKKTRIRTFLQRFKVRYDVIGRALGEVEARFIADGRRRPEFAEGDPAIEISRLLGWIRVTHGAGETWAAQPHLPQPERAQRLQGLLDAWHTSRDISSGDMIYTDRELGNIARIRENLASPLSIAELSYDDLFDTLSGCHAFYELLRFTRGSIEGLRVQFGELNTLDALKRSLTYLLHAKDPIDPLVRAYDLLHDPAYKLHRFGESCVMELIGWADPSRRPVNGRTIKALRYLGFDVA
ncbi:hypothetical protein D3C71_182500 [compost metagenome]